MFGSSNSGKYKNASSLGVKGARYNTETRKWENMNVLARNIERRSTEYKFTAKFESCFQSKSHYTEINFNKEGLKAYILSGSVMTPFISGDKTLSQAGMDMDRPQTIEFTINAQFLEGSYFGDSNNQGKSYAKGKFLGGSSQKEWFYISQDAKGSYSFGVGDPPSGSQNAVGGARPLIINGLPYGEFNKYTEDAPKNLLKKGDPGIKNRKYLIQRSAAYFSQQNDVDKGKTIIGYNIKNQNIIIIVQQDGTNGYSLDAFRNYLVKNGYTNALSFDGSNSSLLVIDKKVVIENAIYKDRTTDSGITFSVPK
ncbi:phosphodiester glycosidase family protein [uncultured Flavobacterium sp.]|uniref:phosphodiester glycosidase family protein n=1 Tax=uncultured Flavobacterium sp. TaxID=165435 RepID=UPI00292F7A44|nr:phosphodiester glycosidase family protein [uncultured Flavobacterium sp.]